MPSEAGFQISNKVGDAIVLLRGDTFSELVENAVAAGLSAEQVGEYYAKAFGGNIPEARAVAAAAPITQAYVPGAVAAPPPAVPPPPTAGYPGDCAHGPRQYKSQIAKSGPRAGQPWNRWECALPWSKDAVGRCANVNA